MITRVNRISILLFSILLSIVFTLAGAGCSASEVKGFSVKDLNGKILPLKQTASFTSGAEGEFSAGKLSNQYLFSAEVKLTPLTSFVVRLECYAPASGVLLKLKTGGRSAVSKNILEGTTETSLQTGAFLLDKGLSELYLTLPDSGVLTGIDIEATLPQGEPDKTGTQKPLFVIKSMKIASRFSGFSRSTEVPVRMSSGFDHRIEKDLRKLTIFSPFSKQGSLPVPDFMSLIESGPGHSSDGASGAGMNECLVVEFKSTLTDSLLKILSGAESFSIRTSSGSSDSSIRRIMLPAILFGLEPAKIELIADSRISIQSCFTASFSGNEPATLDLGTILKLPFPAAIDGTSRDFAVYRWSVIPDVLVFDFKDYATQDLYLKRLAFFVEKKGFTGRLASDEEIADRHGWNAHDYRPEDLSAFFTLAQSRNFKLNSQEIIFRDILVSSGVLLKRGKDGYSPGKGAMISITRESEKYLRSTFMTHESMHAIFFSDEGYRDYASKLWKEMPNEEKWFWRLYFGWMNYNTASDFLMANEVQAYLLQQPVFRAREYFTKTLPSRLIERYPELSLPIANYMQKFGSSFSQRAQSLESWLSSRYGITAGRSNFVF